MSARSSKKGGRSEKSLLLEEVSSGAWSASKSVEGRDELLGVEKNNGGTSQHGASLGSYVGRWDHWLTQS